MSKRIIDLPTTTDSTDKFIAIDSITGISEKILTSKVGVVNIAEADDVDFAKEPVNNDKILRDILRY